MDPKVLISFLGKIEKLKSNTRHCVTADGVPETVAAHSHRIAVMAFLLKEEFPEVNMERVMKMCLIHDFGEAVTGDIPTFDKTEEDEEVEKNAIRELVRELPQKLRMEMLELFDEMEVQETKEAKVFKALDRIEAVLQHNESDLSTWLPLEYELQMTYGVEEAKDFPFLVELRRQLQEDTKDKIKNKHQLPDES